MSLIELEPAPVRLTERTVVDWRELLLTRLYEQAEPELEGASTDWEPFLRVAARAVKLGADELSGAVDKLASYLGTLAEETPTGTIDAETEPPQLPNQADPSTTEG